MNIIHLIFIGAITLLIVAISNCKEINENEADADLVPFRIKRQNNDGFGGITNFPSFATKLSEYEDAFNNQFSSMSQPPEPFKKVIMKRVTKPSGQHIDVPVYLKATLSDASFPKGSRGPIPSVVYAHMNDMQRDINDDAGHLLAYTLGGGMENIFNYVPQSPRSNRQTKGDRCVWLGAERDIKNFLKKSLENQVHWQVIILYRNDSLRPIGFLLKYQTSKLTTMGELITNDGLPENIYYAFSNSVDDDNCLHYMKIDRPTTTAPRQG